MGKCETVDNSCPCLKARIRVQLGLDVCDRENDFQERPAFTVKQKVKGAWNDKEQRNAIETSEQWDFRAVAGEEGVVHLHLWVEPLDEPSSQEAVSEQS